MKLLLLLICLLAFFEVRAMEEILIDVDKEDTLFYILKDEKRREALMNKLNNHFVTTDKCPKITRIFNGSGDGDSEKYYKYSTDILMNLMAEEFNKKSNRETVKGLTEMKVIILVDKAGTLEKLSLFDVHPYGAIRNSGDYVDVQRIFDQIQYKFKATAIKEECGKYEMHATALWKITE